MDPLLFAVPQRYSSKPPVSHSPVPQGWPHHPSLGCSPLCPPSVPLLRLPFRLALPKLALLPPATAVPGSIWHLSAEEKGFLWCQEEITAAPALLSNKKSALPACSSGLTSTATSAGSLCITALTDILLTGHSFRSLLHEHSLQPASRQCPCLTCYPAPAGDEHHQEL